MIPVRRQAVRLLLAASIALILSAPARPQDPFAESEGDREPMEREFLPPSLPLAPEAARTWIALHETKMVPPPDQTPLAEILAAIRAAARGQDGGAPGFEIHLDPICLPEAEITLQSPVQSPYIGRSEVSLNTYLSDVFRQFVWTHRVDGGLVVIESPCDDCAESHTPTAAEARTWLLLHEAVPLRFPDGAPFRNVLAAMQHGLAGRGVEGPGLPIRIAPFVLRNEDLTLDSAVRIDLERAPLRTSLRLILEQLGLGFEVRRDGVVNIDKYVDHENMIHKNAVFMDEAEVSEGLLQAFYGIHWGDYNNAMEVHELKRQLREARAATRPDGEPE